MSFTYDGRDFAAFSKELRAQSPLLAKRMRSRIGKVGRAAATKMRAEVPHPQSGAGKGVRFSDSFSSKGAAIIIGGRNAPQSYAYAFGVGQRGLPGKYKHPVYGKWSGSPKTIMPISDYVVRGWEEVNTTLLLQIEEAVDETIQALAFGELE